MVLAWHYDLEVYAVSIADDDADDANGYVHRYDPFHPTGLTGAEDSRISKRNAEITATIDLAGREAEVTFDGSRASVRYAREHAADDERNAYRALRFGYRGDDVAARDALIRLRGRARRLIVKRWQMVELVARELLRRDRLDAQHLTRLLPARGPR